MKVRTAELIGPALDWAVAKCEEEQDRKITVIRREDYVGKVIERETEFDSGAYEWWSPSRIWSQGGPIIERENLDKEFSEGFGPIPLIAAMRCYVTSKLGHEVEVPDELVEN